jgi:hypothetical protein
MIMSLKDDPKAQKNLLLVLNNKVFILLKNLD